MSSGVHTLEGVRHLNVNALNEFDWGRDSFGTRTGEGQDMPPRDSKDPGADTEYVVAHQGEWDLYAAAWPLSQHLIQRARRLIDTKGDLADCMRLPVPAILIVANRQERMIRLLTGGCAGSSVAFRSSDNEFSVSTSVAQLRNDPSTLNLNWLVNTMCGGETDPCDTPWTNIGHLPIGHSLTWSPGSRPIIRRWYTIPTQRLAGTPEEWIEEYLTRLDSTVRLYREPGGEIPVLMSAGLDSSTVAASAAMIQGSDGVRALIHVPVVSVLPGRGWVGSDLPDARCMSERWPNITIEPVQNVELITPADLLPEYVEQFSVPMFNPGNLVWIHKAQSVTAARHQRRLLTGMSGNRTFSFRLQRGTKTLAHSRDIGIAIDEMRRMARRTGASLWHLIADRVGPETQQQPKPSVPRADYLAPDARALYRPLPTKRARAGFQPGVPMTGSALSLPVNWSPACRLVDVLSAPELVSLVARLPASMFVGEGPERSFARRAMAGRVPDRVRLRAALGVQGWDTSYAYRQRPKAVEAVHHVLADNRVTPLLDRERLLAAWTAQVNDLSGSDQGVERLISMAFFLAYSQGAPRR